MYSPRRISERLTLAADAFHLRPEYHTVEEVKEFDDYLRRKGKLTFNESGMAEGTQSLTPFDVRWIMNERVLAMCDASYFLTRYVFLVDEQGVMRHFEFRIAQRLLFDIIADLEDRGLSIEIQTLKARQLGVTSLVQPLIGHRIFFGYGVNAISASADQQKTGLMVSKMLMTYDLLPVWLRPIATRRVESERGMLVFGATNSGVSFQHGSQMSGIARGSTPTVYHLSECASFQNPEEQIEASLFRAVHASPSIFGVLESTGEGDKGWWPDTWRHSKANWPNRTRLCPLFLPWFCGTELYPTPTWLRKSPVPSDWQPNRETREHVAKSELYVRSSPPLARHLGGAWSMPREQQWYWEVEHEQSKEKNGESIWLQEMASDDEDALQRSAESAFGFEVIDRVSRERKREYDTFGITGQSIEDDHEPPVEDIDYSRERIPIRFTSRKGTYAWELIPLRFATPLREDNPSDAEGKLFIFHPPEPGVDYSIGVDTSAGKGEDSTAISVWSVGKRGSPDVQVAEFASPYVNHTESFSFVFAIAAYYGRYLSHMSNLPPGNTRWPMPYLSVEQVASVGDVCQGQCLRMGYPLASIHKFTRLDLPPGRIRKQKQHPTRLGWFTYGWSRPIVLGYFQQCATTGWAEINSPWLIDEMAHFEMKVTTSGKEKMEHEVGSHDDRIFAAAMATFCPHDTADISERSKKRTVDEVGTLPDVDIGAYGGTVVSASQLKETRALTLADVLYDSSNLERYRY